MKRFVKMYIHDYMDMLPENEYMVFEGKDEKDIVDKAMYYLNDTYKGYSCSVSVDKVMTKKEVEKWKLDTITHGGMTMSALKVWVNYIDQQIKECYDC